jgi:hypothetical protein
VKTTTASGWGELIESRACKVTVVVPPGRFLVSSPRRMLTASERDRAAQVVVTADRINADRPTLSWRMSQTPPPSDGTPDRRPVAWPLASLVAMAIVVFMAFYVAGAR